MPKQSNLFDDTCADMPLFSGTPQRAKNETYKPSLEPRQAAMICKFCFGTGFVSVKKNKPPVACPACGPKGT
jgi:rubrerythrin